MSGAVARFCFDDAGRPERVPFAVLGRADLDRVLITAVFDFRSATAPP
jgi:hypothetical protein